ncbi:MAG: hypothetical protein RLZ98_2615 [Pseudomonadota bacterium]|jgi:hypothetical protein
MANRSKHKPQGQSERKQRRCMMCRRMFLSEWVGERVCKKCKATVTWKSA